MKNLLFLTTDVPVKLNSGYKIRVSNTLKKLSKLYNIHILHVGDNQENYLEYSSYSFMQARKKSVLNLFLANLNLKPFLLFRFSPNGLQSKIDNLIVHYDIDIIYINMTVYDINIDKRVNIIVDQHDFISETMENAYKAQSSIISKLVFFLEYKKFQKYENDFYKKYDRKETKIMCVKIEDVEKTKAFSKNSNIAVIENGYHIHKNDEIKYDPLIIFIGTSHQRNLNALHEFYNNVLPLIHQEMSNIHIEIIGAFKIKDLEFIDFKKYNISAHVFVENIASYYRYGAINVLPYKMGGGSKLKVLESFGYGVPVVGYPLTFQGIKVSEDYISSSSLDLAKRVIKLATNKKDYDYYSQKCKNLAQSYEWDILTNKMVDFLDE